VRGGGSARLDSKSEASNSSRGETTQQHVRRDSGYGDGSCTVWHGQQLRIIGGIAAGQPHCSSTPGHKRCNHQTRAIARTTRQSAKRRCPLDHSGPPADTRVPSWPTGGCFVWVVGLRTAAKFLQPHTFCNSIERAKTKVHHPQQLAEEREGHGGVARTFTQHDHVCDADGEALVGPRYHQQSPSTRTKLHAENPSHKVGGGGNIRGPPFPIGREARCQRLFATLDCLSRKWRPQGPQNQQVVSDLHIGRGK
jgi:hypothetical protein